MRFQCRECGGIVAVDNTDLDCEVQCGHCGKIVRVPSSRVTTGTVIGDFIIRQELGRGGMGIVYLAHQISLDRSAAVKVLSETYANNAEFVVGFIKEARAAAKLNHPHIVQAYAVGEDDGIFYFAMENIDGETMKSVLKREALIPVDQAVSIIQQIAEALNYAWVEQRLIHRDIKPDNIMLTSNGRAKLADLGLARVAGDIDDSEDDEVMGTPQYISPEHLTGAPMDVRSDIYSLGATFYHFVTGNFPFEGRNAVEIAQKHLNEPLIPPNAVNSDVPEKVSRIIEKMMAKNPIMRYQDAESLIDDLRAARRGKGANPTGKKGMVFTNTQLRTDPKISKTNMKPRLRPSGATRDVSLTTSSGMTGTRNRISMTSSHTSTIYRIKEKRAREAATRKKMFALLFVISLLVIGGVLLFTLSGKKKKPSSANSGEVKREKNSPAYESMRVILAFSELNKKDVKGVHAKCEDFISVFPGPASKKEDDSFLKIQNLFRTSDECLAEISRKSEIASHESAVTQARQERRAREQEEKRRKDEEERQARLKELAEAEAAKIQKMNEEQCERMRQDFEVGKSKYLASLVNPNSVDQLQHVKRTTAGVTRQPGQGEDPRLIPHFRLRADEFEAWYRIAGSERINTAQIILDEVAREQEFIDKYKKLVEAVNEIDKKVLNSGNELAGMQLIHGSEIHFLKNASEGILTLDGPIVKQLKVLDLAPRERAKLVRRSAELVKLEDKLYFYYLMDDDLREARVQMNKLTETQEEAKAIYKEVLQHYFKKRFDETQDSKNDREILKKRYGSLPEYKEIFGAP